MVLLVLMRTYGWYGNPLGWWMLSRAFRADVYTEMTAYRVVPNSVVLLFYCSCLDDGGVYVLFMGWCRTKLEHDGKDYEQHSSGLKSMLCCQPQACTPQPAVRYVYGGIL